MEGCEGTPPVTFHGVDGLFPAAWVVQPVYGGVVGREDGHEPVVWVRLEEGPVVGVHAGLLGNVVHVGVPFDQSLQPPGRVLEVPVPVGSVRLCFAPAFLGRLQIHLPAPHPGDPPRLEL